MRLYDAYITSSLKVVGDSVFSGSVNISGSLYATSSWALTASYALNGGTGGTGNGFPFTGSAVLSGSLAVTGSVTVTQGITGSLEGTASWAQNLVSNIYDLGNQAGSLTIDLSLSKRFKFTMTGSISGFTFVSESLGQDYMFEITRNLTNHSMSFAAGKFRFPIGSAPVLTNPTTNGTSPAKAVDILTGVCMTASRLDLVITPDLQNN